MSTPSRTPYTYRCSGCGYTVSRFSRSEVDAFKRAHKHMGCIMMHTGRGTIARPGLVEETQ